METFLIVGIIWKQYCVSCGSVGMAVRLNGAYTRNSRNERQYLNSIMCDEYDCKSTDGNRQLFVF